MNAALPEFLGGALPLVAVAYFVCMVIVHVAFAAAVRRDADQMMEDHSGPWIVGPFFWMLATLLGGVLVAGLYWLVHHSTLSRR